MEGSNTGKKAFACKLQCLCIYAVHVMRKNPSHQTQYCSTREIISIMIIPILTSGQSTELCKSACLRGMASR